LIKWEFYPNSSRKGAKAQRTQSCCSKSLSGSSRPLKCGSFFLYTEEIIFFAQPQIIREEAVFIGINTLIPSSSSAYKIAASAPPRETLPNKSIKRSVVRKFCEGSVNAADLGPVKIRRDKGEITLYKAEKDFFECGISRLLK
ncbi:MAG: hypothetical protein FWB95_08020, partial [Treponema sp.]|nr:hypothetical protein [Treponema sp.]